MKELLTKVTAVLLIIWYSMSIIGFEVHTCSGSGKSFIVSFVEGFSCEDIHPEHHCQKGSCCSHSQACCENTSHTKVESKSCCSGDYRVLALTGTVTDEKNGIDDSSSFLNCHCICSDIFDLNANVRNPQLISHYPANAFCPGRIPDVQSVLSVWRI